MRTSSIVWIIIILVIVAAGIWFFMSTPETPGTNINVTPTTTDNGGSPATSTPSMSTTTPGTTTAPMSVTVHYTSSGFTPKSVTIAKGGTVTWVNDTSSNMWVASASHPSHTGYDGTTLQQHCSATGGSTFDQCKNGNTYSFMFDKTGTWNYHNHSSAQNFGSVVVQ